MAGAVILVPSPGDVVAQRIQGLKEDYFRIVGHLLQSRCAPTSPVGATVHDEAEVIPLVGYRPRRGQNRRHLDHATSTILPGHHHLVIRGYCKFWMGRFTHLGC